MDGISAFLPLIQLVLNLSRHINIYSATERIGIIMELYEFKVWPNESIVGYCCYVLLLTNVLNLTQRHKKFIK